MESGAFKPQYSTSTSTAQGTLLPSVTVTGALTATGSARFSGGPHGGSQNSIQIANTTTSWAYVNFGNLDFGVVTAATVATGFPVAPGMTRTVTVGGDVSGASVILGTAPGTATAVIFTRGVGL